MTKGSQPDWKEEVAFQAPEKLQSLSKDLEVRSMELPVKGTGCILMERRVVESIKYHYSGWVEIGAQERVLEWVKLGVPLEPMNSKRIGRCSTKEHAKMTEEEMDFTDKEVQRMLREGVTEDLGEGLESEPPLGVTWFSRLKVAPKIGPKKFRLCVNMYRLNQYFPDRIFKYEGLGTVLKMVKKGWWMLSFDLASGYHQVSVREQSRRWLAFHWKGRWYRYRVLPFGHKLSPWFFTKIMRAVLSYWRSLGIFVVSYLDDFLVTAATREKLLEIRDRIIQPTLEKLGLIREESKGCWKPTQRIAILGLEIDSVLGKVLIPQQKLEKLMSYLERVKGASILSARELARIAGTVISISRAFSPARMLTWEFFRLIAAGRRNKWEWDHKVITTEKWRQDVETLKDLLPKFNGKTAWETHFFGGSGGRLFKLRVGSSLQRFQSRRSLASRYKRNAYKHERTVGNSKSFANLAGFPKRKSYRGQNRFNGSKSLCGKGRRSIKGFKFSGKINLGVGNRKRRYYRGGTMETWKRKHNPRRRKQKGGSFRLENKGGNFPVNRQKIWSSHGRPVCFSGKHTAEEVQFTEMVPRDGSSELFHSELGWRKQLPLPSFRFDSSHSGSPGILQGRGNNHSSRMDSSTVVAPIITDESGFDSTRRGERLFLDGVEWSKRALQAPSLELHSRTSKRNRDRGVIPVSMEQIKRRKLDVLGKSVSVGTMRNYGKSILAFDQFLIATKKKWEEVNHEVILDFICWLDLQGWRTQINTSIFAIRAWAKSNGREDPTVHPEVKMALNSFARILAEEKEFSEERLPLPVNAWRLWLENPTSVRPASVWWNAAMSVGLGLRLIRRPSEIVNLTWKDLKWERKEDGKWWLWVHIGKTKTNQFGKKDKWVPIEPGRLDWLNILKKRYDLVTNLDDFIFPSRIATGKHMSVSTFSKWVKRIAEFAQLKGRYTGHSVRIGGATAAMEGGLTLAQIRAIGDWESRAVLLYLRLREAAKLNASAKMGF